MFGEEKEERERGGEFFGGDNAVQEVGGDGRSGERVGEYRVGREGER